MMLNGKFFCLQIQESFTLVILEKYDRITNTPKDKYDL